MDKPEIGLQAWDYLKTKNWLLVWESNISMEKHETKNWPVVWQSTISMEK